MLLVLVVVMATLSPRFLSWINIANLMGQMAVPLIVAAGMTIVMISGEFDISVGSVVALSAAVSAHGDAAVRRRRRRGGGLALIGPAIGWLNGMVTTKGRIPSFIVTLGTMMMARSLAFVVTGGKVVSDLPEGFKALGQARIAGVPLLFLIALLHLRRRLVRADQDGLRQARLCGRRQPDGGDPVRHPRRPGQDPVHDDRGLHRLVRRQSAAGPDRRHPGRHRRAVSNSR